MRIFLSMVLAVFLTSGSLAVFAADANEPPPEHTKHKPPQVAFDACKGLTENATCQFSGRNNDIVTGVCSLPPPDSGDTNLVCRPNHPPKDRDHKSE